MDLKNKSLLYYYKKAVKSRRTLTIQSNVLNDQRMNNYECSTNRRLYSSNFPKNVEAPVPNPSKMYYCRRTTFLKSSSSTCQRQCSSSFHRKYSKSWNSLIIHQYNTLQKKQKRTILFILKDYWSTLYKYSEIKTTHATFSRCFIGQKTSQEYYWWISEYSILVARIQKRRDICASA